MKNNLASLSRDYYRIEKAIRFLENNFQDQPDLEKMAHAAGVSSFYFQRMFQRWAGISPKKFLQFLTKEHIKNLLKGSNLLDVSYEAGLSGPGRLHDLFVNFEAMSPGEYKLKGKGLTIFYGFHPTPFGKCFIASTERGICCLRFLDEISGKDVIKNFLKEWENARCVLNQNKTAHLINKIFFSSLRTKKDSISLLCRGTNFQIKVWEALLHIPSGKAVSYQDLAKQIGHPKAMRAVGTAVGRNPVAYLIPCHRVIRSMGELGGYRWGISRKKAILGIESLPRRSASRL